MAFFFGLPHNGKMHRSSQKNRNPVAAAFLSVASLGLGQIYNGELVKGLLLKALATLTFCLFALRVFLDGSWDLLFFTGAVSAFVVMKTYSVGQAFRRARRDGAGYALKKFNRVGVYLGLTLVFLFLAYRVPRMIERSVVGDFSEFHPFRSAGAKARFLEIYDRKSGRWPIDSESRMVTTSFGRTLVRIGGPAGAPPLVLLHGIGGSSLQWQPNIEALSRDFKTYAVDNIYDNGRSVYTFVFRTPDDFVEWLDELFDALGLGDRIKLAGLSYGGWLTSRYALRHPGRLDKIVLIAPVATVMPLRFDWIWRAVLCGIPHRYFSRHFMDWMLEDLARGDASGRAVLDEETEFGFVALRCFKPKPLVSPTVLTDEEWQSLRVPALFLVGENEKLYPAERAVVRLGRVAPRIRAEILSGCGHDLTLVRAAAVNRRVIDFLKAP